MLPLLLALAAAPLDLACLAPPTPTTLSGAAGQQWLKRLRAPPGWETVRELADGEVRIRDPQLVQAVVRELAPSVRFNAPTPDRYWELTARALFHLPLDAKARAFTAELMGGEVKSQASECALAAVVDVDANPVYAPLVRGLLDGWRWRCAVPAAATLPHDAAVGERLLSLSSAVTTSNFSPWARAVLRHVADRGTAEAAVRDVAGTLRLTSACAPSSSAAALAALDADGARPAAVRADLDAADLHGLIVAEVSRGPEWRGTGWGTSKHDTPFDVLGPLTLPAHWLGDDVPSEGWALDVLFADQPAIVRGPPSERPLQFLPFVPSCSVLSGDGPWVSAPTSKDFAKVLAWAKNDVTGDGDAAANPLHGMKTFTAAEAKTMKATLLSALEARVKTGGAPTRLVDDLAPLVRVPFSDAEEARLLAAVDALPGGACALDRALGPSIALHPNLVARIDAHVGDGRADGDDEGLACALPTLPWLPPRPALAPRLRALVDAPGALSPATLVHALSVHDGGGAATDAATRLWHAGDTSRTALVCDATLSTTTTQLVPLATATLSSTPPTAPPSQAALLALALQPAAATTALSAALSTERARPTGARHLVNALGRLDRRAVPALRPLLRDPQLRRPALFALGFLGPEARDASADVIALAHDADLAVRRGAAAALMALQDASTTATLLALAGEEDPGVREFAACGLAILPTKTQAVTSRLTTLARDPVEPVRFCARQRPAKRTTR